MRNTLICTVGTSLLGNLRRNQEEALAKKNWQQLVFWLLDLPNTARECGAEINSIASICNQKFLTNTFRLILLISETEDGKVIGEILRRYYENSKNPIRFECIEVRTIAGLRDDSISAFKQQGLKNLVREISEEAKKYSPETLAINATGGYKAQISFAGTIGQALGIPVYYLFEKFSETIELPPQPVSLDLAFWLENYTIFEEINNENTIEKTRLGDSIADEAWRSLLDEESFDDVCYVSLSVVGVLFHERARLQFAKQETKSLNLIPKVETEPDKKTICLRDDHGNDTLREFSQKIRRSPYVVEIVNSLPFNSRRTDPILRVTDNGLVDFVLTWTDKGLGICVRTTGRNKVETNTIALHLKRKYFE